MAIRVALHHRTTYQYDRPVAHAPHVIRLRPAPHCRTKIESYSMRITPVEHFCNWQQDPFGNFLARLVFPSKALEFQVTVDLVADMSVINPFDFFLEDGYHDFPFIYDSPTRKDLQPYLEAAVPGPRLEAFLRTVDRTPRRIIDFLVDLNQRLQRDIRYIIRMEPGVQTPEETLGKASGSCRDTSWLLVQALRHLGLAARFASGYLIQLAPDVKALDGPSGTELDFTDLHAWCEVYLPGAGWIGLDPTSGLLCGEGHIPLACTPEPSSAAPITGAVDECETMFDFAMTVSRIHEDPRVTKPYTDAEWARIEALGHEVDARLREHDVRLTMGGEPTFVSIDDYDGEEWNFTAVGPTKKHRANELIRRLRRRFAPGGLLHFGQGKWYPGEPLPRWAYGCYWRRDGVPVWEDEELIARDDLNYGHTAEDAHQFVLTLAERLEIDGRRFALPSYEDVWYYLWREKRLPLNVDPLQSRLDDELERERLRRVFHHGLGHTVGYTLPIQRDWTGQKTWMSGAWFMRNEHLFLIPGDSPMGYRLPLDSLGYAAPDDRSSLVEVDPFADLPPLPSVQRRLPPPALRERPLPEGSYWSEFMRRKQEGTESLDKWRDSRAGLVGIGLGPVRRPQRRLVPPPLPEDPHRGELSDAEWLANRSLQPGDPAPWIVRTALCVEPREGHLKIFMPPVSTLEEYIDLVAAVEDTAASLGLPCQIEGYKPPRDPRLNMLGVTPDPGVIEVNTHPAHTWDELVQITTGLYEDARQSRLGTEKFMVDGRHTGTGGGNHVVLGGPTPADSPLLRRPDLLKSLVAYWNNHPALSFLFSGQFVGATSQAPRVDQGRDEAVYELEVALNRIPSGEGSGWIPPWLTDRIFRNLLVDVTGNTHRAEFCIDKLYSPDGFAGRQGLLEFRAFEMPPHARMSLTQQLLLRALVARFWEHPYEAPLVRWGTELHDRFMLPHFVAQDFTDVVDDLQEHGFPIDPDWFAAHHEFRFPHVGEFGGRDVRVDLRTGIEPWHVLGEEGMPGGTVRYVDSSLERLEVKVTGMVDPRHVLSCNGRRVPLHNTGSRGEFVAGIRFRAWPLPESLHPTIPAHAPLVFDLVDRWNGRSIAGATYYVSHPGGRSFETRPVNAYEAEGRRLARYSLLAHTPGSMPVPELEPNPAYPFTLDLRRE